MFKYNIYLYAFVVFGTSDITLKCLLKGEPDEKKTTNPTSPLITKQLRVREYQKFEDNWIYRSFQAIFCSQTRRVIKLARLNQRVDKCRTVFTAEASRSGLLFCRKWCAVPSLLRVFRPLSQRVTPSWRGNPCGQFSGS